MRRIQVVIDPELDDWLAHEAAVRRTSKSAVIRDCVRGEAEKPYDNGLSRMPVFDDIEPVDDIDEFLYGPGGVHE
jgi:hypothetical protein